MTFTPQNSPRVEALVAAALRVDSAARATFLVSACGDDAELRRQVETLLAEHDRDAGLLETPAHGASAAPDAGWIGRTIGTYRVTAMLGAGGMGEVYAAHDTNLDRPVAIKLLPAAAAADDDRLRRFRAEARAASSLNHPHILVVHDFGEVEGRPFIVTELVEGETLRERLLTGPLAVREAVDIAAQVASALTAAHARGLLHRDIKPENIMVRPDGYVKVLDFGLAKLVTPESGDAASALVTRPGTVMGTPRYMSPEQARGLELDARTDVWSLGVLVSELVAGRAPFGGATVADVIAAILGAEADPLDRHVPGVPRGLGDIVATALAKDRADRYPSAREMHAALVALRAAVDSSGGQPASDWHADPSAASASAARSRQHTVGRDRERAEVLAACRAVASGRSGVLSLSGEPGSGKTTLVEDCLAVLADCRVARGRCSERLAGTEAYLPVLEALESLMQGPGAGAVRLTMKNTAPSWYTQLAQATPGAGVGGDAGTPVPAGSQERLKRELWMFLRELSRTRPLVLFFDDIHWADVSTIDLIGYLSGRLNDLRLLLIVTSRPSDLQLANHPFLQLRRDLQSRGICHDLTLEYLTTSDIQGYLALEFPGHQFPSELPALIHSKTEGSPLFVADLVRYLTGRGTLVADEDGRWILRGSLSEIGRELPESVRGMIERKIAQLPDDDRALLTAASVQGNEFDSAVVARALSLDAARVEERLEVLERVHHFVQFVDEREFPDRTLTLRYRFVHVLYQNALYGQLRATRRTSLSAAIAETLLRMYASRDHEVASELAVLFEEARDFRRASDYCRVAAGHAATLFASREAVVLARRGLALLEKLPVDRDRAERELTMRLVLGNALIATRGYAADEVEETYSRARDLCEQLGETPHLSEVLYGFAAFYLVRANHPLSLRFGEELLAFTERLSHPAVVVGHRLIGWPLLAMGELQRAHDSFEASDALYDAATHRPLAFTYGQEPGMSARVCLAMALWLLGYPDQARARCREGLDLARLSSHGNSQAYAYHWSATCDHFMGDAVEARERIDAELMLADDQGLALWKGWGAILHGWAVVDTLGVDAAVAEIRRGLDAVASLGARLFNAYYLAILAEVLLKAGRASEGLTVIEEALPLVAESGERFWEAEIVRLHGELLLATGAPVDRVEALFTRSIAIAQRQGGKSLELRAATSLARLLQTRGDQTRAREVLAGIYDWFTEGFDTADLKDARAQLDRLERAARAGPIS